VISPEKETLKLKKEVKITGKVEQWLSKLEKNIFKTMETTLIDSEYQLKNIERIEWIFQWPGQVVLIINSLDWTRKVEINLADNIKLKEFYNESSKNLIKIVDSVRSDHTKLQRQTLESLVTIDVHNRDILEELIKHNTMKSSDFLWQAQMRYYMSNNNPLEVHMIYASRPYGFEYLGNTTRLVITPLTARCFRTLFSAYYLTYGGGPEGPAGTGIK
jgi:dynein heavy chain